ncbi:cation diffusion facilitator CzcD-associated flavoprotein CzcO [Kibdelosporangium banguiense]|uniref:Cation diffusion facilitator CzcD-associated flavoprotein CzcO n=1 Tax=Kibdelosporangium banguiense TaxID=1365924 RepID=A0ABS4TUH3_9PSEU|nr:NAD(P)/FAD-dependent oxidoreductase [Kibdelosporangium banguiense]MBP2328069.1 cation diffusion facilitator CzcD-associated flavoprotein CzcO [Kibdelosporangium banguiense]
MSKINSGVSVAIIGAGFGGLCMAAELKRMGIESFVIFEKADEVGGIWRDNTYPGCGCDVPSHLYSYSFERYRSATVRYPGQQDILDYLRRVTEKYDLRRHLKTGAEVVSADYDEMSAHWTIVTGDGLEHVFDVVVSAVGQLHRPKFPKFAGWENFHGEVFHTAEWDHGVDLTGRDVAVVGTGSSAAQLLPHVAERARRVSVFQRTPSWVIPKPKAEFGRVTRWAFDRFPALQPAYRAATYLAADTLLTPVIRRGWTFQPTAWAARRHLRRQVPDRVVRANLTPDYPIGCKRIVIDNSYYPAFNRENVHLVTEGIARLTPSGIKTEDGTHHPADVIVYATGFRTTEFLVPMTVRGRGGKNLHEQWATAAEAYLGIAVPGFPNFFMVHGPNTILGHNSNIFMIECQVHYILNCLRMLPGEVEVRTEAMDSYRSWLNTAISRTVWQAGCDSWYKTESGHVTNPWPASTRKYRKMTRRDPSSAFSATRRQPVAT